MELKQFKYKNFKNMKFLCVNSLCEIGAIHIRKFHTCEIFMREIKVIYRDYFMVGERVRFLFTGELLQPNE